MAQYGELVPTEVILRHLASAESLADNSFNTEFVKNRLGIESVAFTQCTLDYCREIWGNKDKYTPSSAFAASQARANKTLYQMLSQALAECKSQLQTSQEKSSSLQISRHIHIVTFVQPTVEYELNKIPLENGISQDKTLSTLIIQQGCAGILSAIELAHSFIKASNDPSAEHVLITCENNMLMSAHQLLGGAACTNNINEWLWSAIFGEGVGAIIVGGHKVEHPIRLKFNPAAINSTGKQTTINWLVCQLSKEAIVEDWRVVLQLNETRNHSSVIIRAREVSETYLKGVTKHAKAGIENFKGINNIFQVCLHESNPNLVQTVANNLGISLARVPSISTKVGTLACVSAFSLLDKANREFIKELNETENLLEQNLVFSLIGEAGGRVDAGHLCLSPLLQY